MRKKNICKINTLFFFNCKSYFLKVGVTKLTMQICHNMELNTTEESVSNKFTLHYFNYPNVEKKKQK